MEKQKSSSGLLVLVIVLIICVLGLSGYIVCDKLVLGKTSTINNLSGKYYNTIDKDSYITFSSNGTWTSSQNQCEGYAKLTGTYSIHNNEIILESDNFYTKKNTLIIESIDEKLPILIYDKDGAVANCSESQHFVVEKQYK